MTDDSLNDVQQKQAEHKARAKQALDTANRNVEVEPILQFFEFSHLPSQLQAVSVKFYELACTIVTLLPRNPERTVALRKLLEAKDAAVRAKLSK